ncbi:MAG: TlpA disulfide reductase family protein [Methylococcales bacterium]|nr:TlpA disulfide reductase family protein [Methylococcales bacterium]
MKKILNNQNRLHIGPYIVLLFTILCPAAHAIEAGADVPDCQLKHLSGDKLLQLSMPGKVVYVDFWASWCGPCVQSMPFMNEIQEQYRSQGLNVVAINLDENREDAEAFLKEHPANITIAQNTDGQCPDRFGVHAMPSSYLVDKHGKIRFVNLGFHASETDEVHQKIQSLLREN